MIDTLRLARQLRDAGIPEAQAEAIVHGIREAVEPTVATLATKQDLAPLATKAELAELKSELAELRVEIHRDIRELALKIGGLLLAQAAFVVALIKLLPGG